MTFLSPAFALIGLAAATIPIIIHFLFRRRFSRVDWAPMKYLRLSLESNRKRIQFQQLLLLIIRVLVVLCLFFTAARPMLSKQFSSWLSNKQPVSLIVVIDDSLSMEVTSNEGRSIFQFAKSVALELIRENAANCELTMMRSSSLNLPLVQKAHLDDTSDLMNEVNDLEPTDISNQWTSIFYRLDELLSSSAYTQREIVIITDLQRTGWDEHLPSEVSAWKDVEITIVDVGESQIGNLGVQEIRSLSPLVASNSVCRFEATVRNFSGFDVEPASATFSVDGQTQTIAMPTIPANAVAKIPFRVVIHEPGERKIRFAIPDDRLNGDNSRFMVVDAKKELSILMIDGDPRTEPMASEVDFLVAACRSGRSIWNVRDDDELNPFSLQSVDPDVLVLANVAEIDLATSVEIEKRVAAGMGLVIYGGDQIDKANYNQLLHKNGAGVLPCKLDDPITDDFSGLLVDSHRDSPLEVFETLPTELLRQIRPRRVLVAALRDEANAMKRSGRVLAQWNHVEKSPALIEGSFGKGRVFVWTITADREWSDWQLDPSFVIAARQTMLFAAAGSNPASSMLVGDPFRAQLPVTANTLGIRLQRPDNRDDVDLSPDLENTSASVLIDDTRHAGFYHLKWDAADDEPTERILAFNTAVEESDLQRMSRDDFYSLFGETNWRLATANKVAADRNLQAELWKMFAVFMLLLLAMESGLNAWIGRAG